MKPKHPSVPVQPEFACATESTPTNIIMSSGQGETTIAVKAICGDDIRRFHLPQGAGFESLANEVVKRFSLEGKQIALKFKDDENEWCSLTTDEDLSEAQSIAKQLTPPILRVQIWVSVEVTGKQHARKDAPTSASAADEFAEAAQKFFFSFPEAAAEAQRPGHHAQHPPAHPVVHHGVTCDASGMSPIIGARYHKIGEDYDLCEAEFAKISSTDKSLYEKIDLPRHNPCHGFPRMFGFGGGRGFKFGGHFQGHPHAMGGQHPFAGGRGFGKKGGWWRQHGAGGPLSARFVADVNLPDGTNVEPGNKFIKTWRLRNDGTATWPATTGLVFLKGDQLHTDNVKPVGAVAVGDECEISVEMIAPEAPGRYVSFWRLSASGEAERNRPHSMLLAPFGQRLWVQVLVSEDGTTCNFVQDSSVQAAEDILESNAPAASAQPPSTAEPTPIEANLEQLKELATPFAEAFGLPAEFVDNSMPMLANVLKSFPGSEGMLQSFLAQMAQSARDESQEAPASSEHSKAASEHVPQPFTAEAEASKTAAVAEPPTVVQSPAALPGSIEEKLKQLHDMGFLNEAENRAAIEKAEGEVHRAIDLLMSETVGAE